MSGFFYGVELILVNITEESYDIFFFFIYYLFIILGLDYLFIFISIFEMV